MPETELPKMPSDAVAMQVGNAGQKIRLLSLHDLDRRTAAYRRTVDLIEAIENDAGGHDRLSTGERQIIQRIALTCTLAEHLRPAGCPERKLIRLYIARSPMRRNGC